MSLDSVAGSVPPANIAAIIAGELAALAADAQTLGARLSAGDVVAAIVLPSNGLTDLLDVGGLRVAAELPPALLPGEEITVLVTGIGDGRINLRILSSAEPGASGSAVRTAPLERSALHGELQPTATVRGIAHKQLDSDNRSRIDDGRAPLRTPAASAPPASAPPARAPLARAPLAPPRSAASASPELKIIEARLAAAHATSAPSAARPAPRSPVAGLPAASDAQTPGNAAGRLASRPAPAALRPFIGVRAPLAAALPAAPGMPAAARAREPAAFTEPAALLRGLRLPVTATNLASARMALESPQKLPQTLATLDRALVNKTDQRLTTLATLTAFVGRLEPRSPVFAAQIAAFVDHVVTGGEAKIAQLVRAWGSAAPSAAGETPTSGAPAANALERIAVGRIALEYDLKTQLLAFAADRPNTAGPAASAAALNAAVAGALTAITALQLNAATALSLNPDGLAFTLPIALADGFAAARIRIDRDAPDGRQSPLDGDNFHIGFVLETRHLGTIGIDLNTVGRAVTLSVKTEAALAQRALGTALTDLTARLEKLHYRVAKADAVVAPSVAASRTSGRVIPVADPNRLVDTDA